jgi:ATP-binding cassette subfamily B protein
MKSLWLDTHPKTTNPMKFLWYVSRPHHTPMVIAIIAVTLASIVTSVIPYIFKLIANAAASIPSPSAYHDLLFAATGYIILRLVAEAIWRVSGFAGALWATGARATGRQALTSYVTLHSRNYFSDRFAGTISNKIGHASNGTREMIEELLWQFLQFFISIIASFILAYITNPLLAYIFLVWVIVIALINLYFTQKRIPLAKDAQDKETALNGATVDLLSNITAVQDYARRKHEIERLQRMSELRRKVGVRNWHYGERILSFNGLLQGVFSTVMVFVAVFLAQKGSISPGDVILVISILFNIEGQMLFLGTHLNSFGERWGEITESLEEILEPLEIPDRPDAIDLSLAEGTIDFKNVTFSYAGNSVFDRLNLHITAGERIGLVGRSGAGKSTLMRLLLHHHDIQSGQITIGNADIASLRQESLRAAIAIVPQESILFHRTIRENIAYGNTEATEQEIMQAAQLAHAHEFIQRLPGAYESMVGERGVKLSGGERQRIAIARAILKNAPILLLDEATSALDSESERAIQDALRELMKGKTVIAIAHRLSTLREMDRLIVLDRGAIIEEGKHDELVKNGSVYAELWRHQAGGFIQE